MDEIPVNNIVKQETVGYLKSKINLQQAVLLLSAQRLTLKENKATVNSGGILGFLIKKQVEKDNVIFSLNLADIQKISQGKHGMQNNVLEIKDRNHVTHRVIVKDYLEWENSIRLCQLKAGSE